MVSIGSEQMSFDNFLALISQTLRAALDEKLEQVVEDLKNDMRNLINDSVDRLSQRLDYIESKNKKAHDILFPRMHRVDRELHEKMLQMEALLQKVQILERKMNQKENRHLTLLIMTNRIERLELGMTRVESLIELPAADRQDHY